VQQFNVAAPPTAAARQFVAAGTPQTDLAGLGDVDFADVLTQLLGAPAGEPGAGLQGLLKKTLARSLTAAATPVLALDGAADVVQPQVVDIARPRQAETLSAAIEPDSTVESPDALAAAMNVAGMLLLAFGSTARPPEPATAADASASTGATSTADTPDRRTAEALPAPAIVAAGRQDAPSPTLSAPAAEAPPAAVAGDPNTLAPVDAIETTATAQLPPAAVDAVTAAATATHSALSRLAASAVAPSGPRSTAEISVHTGVDPSSTDASVTAIDRDASKGDARTAGGHGQTPHDAPAPAAPPEALTPVLAAALAVNGQPAGAIGQGLSLPLRAADAAELSPQIVQAIKLQWQGGVGEARIRLQPDYLGELTIAIRVERGGVTASLESDTLAVRQWLQGHEMSLRQGLSDQGLQLDRLLVSEQSSRADWQNSEKHQPDEPQSRGRKHSSRRRRPDEQTFEVVV
jgi:flagellar hook-length control protein FliK